MSIPTSELFFRQTATSPFSSDAEQKAANRVAPRAIAPQDTAKLGQIIAQINAKLDQGEQVDLTQYPPLFVVHYRGTHFFQQFSDHTQRHDLRQKIRAGNFKEGIYSPACYEVAGIPLGAPIDTPEKKRNMYEAIRLLSDQFETLTSSACNEPCWWGQSEHETLLFQHYQRYVNTYEKFRVESADQSHDCYKVLDCTTNPYVSTADHPKHAIMYALGAKSDLQATPLRPGYDTSLQPKHPEVGHVQIIFHRLTSIAKTNPLPLSTLHASKKVAINTRILNERETTYRFAISSRHVEATCIARFPAMNVPYTKGFHDAVYGFSLGSYTQFQTSLKNKSPNTTFVNRIAEALYPKLTAQAEKIASEKGGYVVYLGLDGRLSRHLPTTIEITRAKDPTSLYEEFRQNLKLYAHSVPSSDEYPELQAQEDDDQVNESYRVPVEGYGNHFYAAVLHQIRERTQAANYKDVTENQLLGGCVYEINNHSQLYEGFKEGDKTLQDLVDEEWHDPQDFMLHVTANTLNFRIVILAEGNKKIINPRQTPIASIYLEYDPKKKCYDSLLAVTAVDEGIDQLNDAMKNLAVTQTVKPQHPAVDHGYDGDDDKTKNAKGRRKK